MTRTVYFLLAVVITASLLLGLAGCAKPTAAPTPAPAPKPAPPATSAAPAKPPAAPAPTAVAKPPPAPAPAPAKPRWPDRIRIGTKPAGSSTYIQAVAMATLIEKYVGIKSFATPFSTASAFPNGLKNKEIEMAIQATTTGRETFLAEGEWSGSPPMKEGMGLTTGEPVVWTFFVAPGSGIKSPADLKGKKWMGVWAGSVQSKTAFDAVTRVFGLTEQNVTFQKFSKWDEIQSAIREKRTDASFYWCAEKMPWLEEMAVMREVELISLAPDAVKKVAEMTIYIPTSLPAGYYTNQTKQVDGFGYYRLVQIRADLPDDLAYAITAAMYDHFDELAAFHPTIKQWALPQAVLPDRQLIPFHPGVVKYFKDKGWWKKEHDDMQARLIKEVKL